jgi:acyl-CoA hydrolase
VPTELTPALLAELVAAAREVHAPGCAGHSSLFAGWIAERADCIADTRFSGVHIPGVNRHDWSAVGTGARFANIFLSADFRAGYAAGRIEYRPWTYTRTWRWLRDEARYDLVLLQVAPPDARGMCSLGVACDFAPALLERGFPMVAHVNPAMPRSDGPAVPWSALAAAVEAELPLLEVADAAPDASLAALADVIAARIADGSTLQFGLGKLQSALLRRLRGHRGLRIHAGMVSDGLLDLLEAGAIAPRCAVHAGVALGSARLYAAAADAVHFRPVGWTHDARTLAGLERFVAINSALSVDLLGQVDGETVDGRQISGVGGLPDFVRGAALAAGGRAIIALPARRADGASRIVPMLPTGPVSLARHDADEVATEYGVAVLRDADVATRAARLIAIAAPEHRESLARAWAELARRL